MLPMTREKVKPTDLPPHEDSPLWVDHHIDNEMAAEAFSTWLDSELALLEARFSHYGTRWTVMQSLAR